MSAQPVGNEEGSRNPLLEERPWFYPVTTLDMPIYIGEAADAAFTTRFRQALSETKVEHIPRTGYATDHDLLSLSEVDCMWPSPARSRILLQTAFHALHQGYHIVRKSIISQDLDTLLQGKSLRDSLSTCRLWALFALGALCSFITPSQGQPFPGIAYFAQASRLLRVLSERPRVEYMEVLLLLVSLSSDVLRKCL